MTHPTYYAAITALPELPDILARLTACLRRPHDPWRIRNAARADVRAMGGTAAVTAIAYGLIDDVLGWETPAEGKVAA